MKSTQETPIKLLLIFLFILNSLNISAGSFVGNRTDFRDESIYFVMTTRFYNGDKTNDVQCWDGKQYNETATGSDPAWRGDFKGLIEKLDYIKALGFTAVWITPIVQNASGYDYHGYHTLDFSKVDSRYESQDVSFKTLVDAVHAKGMKIILDIVLNHTGNFGENYLCKEFIRNYAADQSQLEACMAPYTQKDGGLLPDNYLSLPSGQQYSTRLALMKNTDGVNHDNKNLWHHYGNFNWDDITCQWAQIAGDCVDLNTENPLVYNYLIQCYTQFINMGVDGFRVDTERHINRLVFNKVFNPAFLQAANSAGKSNFFMFGEVCTRDRNVIYRNTPPMSTPYYTWADTKNYAWSNDQSEWTSLVCMTGTEGFTTTTNQKSCIQNYNDDLDESSWRSSHNSNNAFLDGNNYHTPDYSLSSKMHVIDFPMHWNFENTGSAYGVRFDDKLYNDATFNVTYVDSHDYAPDGAPESQRFAKSQETWAKNLALMFTFRGIPCIYYGSEIEFKKGCIIDKGPNMPLRESGRAYFGGYITGNIKVNDFADYTNASGNIAATLSHPLSLHIQRLNKIRMAIPALRKGQYSTAGCNGDMAFKRRYTDSSTDSYVLVTIGGGATFSDIENGTYTDAVTGNTITVSNSTLNADCSGVANMRIYVLSTSKTPAPGKVGNDGKYLYTSSPVTVTELTYDGNQEILEDATTPPVEPGNIYNPSYSSDNMTVFFEAPASGYNSVKVWCWNSTTNFTGGNWPGAAAELMGTTANGNKIWRWDYGVLPTGNMPTKIIFNNNGSPQTQDLNFTNGGYYKVDGLERIIEASTAINYLYELYNGIKVYKSNHDIVIESNRETILPIFSINGALIKHIQISKGINTLAGLMKGTYIVAGKKTTL
ncbi:MAG: alpha-amylase family glycosyl hydrolase [Paludibacteraceae bacterium]